MPGHPESTSTVVDRAPTGNRTPQTTRSELGPPVITFYDQKL